MLTFLYFLLGLAIHFSIELYDEWSVSKTITWNVHLFPAAISFLAGIAFAIFSGKLNLAGNLLYIAAAVLGFLTNYMLQKLFKWNALAATTAATAVKTSTP